MLDSGLLGKFYHFGETVLLLLYVNFLWICFTLLGGILFGIGPSTVAMFAVFRKWSMGEGDMPAFKTFWSVYRKEFVKANVLGIILLLFGYMLYVNFNFLSLTDISGESFIRVMLIIATAVYVLMIIYIFPMFVHYENKIFGYFKNAVLLAIYSPIRTAYLIAACLTLYYLYFYFPVFIFFLGGSLTSLVIMYISYRTFLRLEYKQEVLNEHEDREERTSLTT
ncbi:putative membrane protein YesL [Gracilibacillus halotolerans]|uniref:Putative membrane protein YesL n=1 Tax=Gracilibacillus halotolerans TaxID=74386 RepID=A0A841RNN4_9BACI|nr:YesL family protein [Gracilibacillus halotolerans]MBB6513213.1 putative membrane protein YesL [Gracilibacillus halotolerans]